MIIRDFILKIIYRGVLVINMTAGLFLGSSNVSYAFIDNLSTSPVNDVFKPKALDIDSQSNALNPGGCTMKQMIQFYRQALGIQGVRLRFAQQRMPNPNMLGYMVPKGPQHYQIVLARGLEASELRVTVAHELVHVSQFETGAINLSEFRKDYMMRSFEDEAFRLSLPLAARFFLEVSCHGGEL